MPSLLTSEQILALAPDPASAKAGAALATGRKWVRLGGDGRAVWGECQGSGAQPYQTRADLADLAAKCSCPSRKFPCKHGIALLLLLATEPELFAAGEPPAWVTEWLTSRTERAEKRAVRDEPDPGDGPRAPDPAAQARRAGARATKVDGGLAELSRWMRDLVRGGLATAPQRPAAFWQTMAARLVDAQAPGAARLVRLLAATPASGDGWQERMLAQLGRLHLLVEAYGRIDALPEPTRADVRARIGFPLSDVEIAACPPVRDRWTVLGQVVEDDERLRARRTWLRAARGGTALLLDFAYGAAPFAEPVPATGVTVDATLAFHPASYAQRAVLRERHDAGDAATSLPTGWSRIAEATAELSGALALDPWVERVALVLDEVVPDVDGERWLVRDAEGDALPLAPRFRAWPLAALAGGRPIRLAGEWDGSTLLPLSASAPGGAPIPLLSASAP